MSVPRRRPVDSELVTPITRPEPSAARQAHWILYLGFIALPIIAGADKFFDFLVNWHQYLAPVVSRVVPVAPHTFMMGVGAIEIVAGLLVALKPSIGGLVVAVWLWGIIVNLLMIPGYYDVALRDFGLSLGGLALARLSRALETEQDPPNSQLSVTPCAST